MPHADITQFFFFSSTIFRLIFFLFVNYGKVNADNDPSVLLKSRHCFILCFIFQSTAKTCVVNIELLPYQKVAFFYQAVNQLPKNI